LHYELENSNTTDDDTYTADSINYVKEGGENAKLENGMEYGKCYKVGLSLPKSDLMITEYEHLNPSGWNYSMVEIYNPTNEVKDLTKYALVRQTYLKGARWSNNKPWYLGCNDDVEDIQNARLQDLWINPTTPANVKYANGDETSTDYTNSVTLIADYQSSYSNTINYSKTINNKTYTWENLEPYQLAPGQTIVLFAGGTKYVLDKSDESRYVYLHNGTKYFNSNYLAEAITAGDCKYAIAVDNGMTDYKNQEAGEERGGVLQAAQTQNFILMKKKDGETNFTILDAVFSLDPTDATRSAWVYNYPMNTSGGGTGTSDDHRIISRRPSVMYPYTIRPVDEYYNVTLNTHVENPLNGPIWDGFDWQFKFPTVANFDVTDSSNGDLLSPGTRNVVTSYKTTD
jgi:hypothetical protein